MTLQALIERYNEMLTNFVHTEDIIKQNGLDYARKLGLVPPSDVNDEATMAVLAAFQTALVNVLNDLDGVVAAQKEGV